MTPTTAHTSEFKELMHLIADKAATNAAEKMDEKHNDRYVQLHTKLDDMTKVMTSTVINLKLREKLCPAVENHKKECTHTANAKELQRALITIQTEQLGQHTETYVHQTGYWWLKVVLTTALLVTITSIAISTGINVLDNIGWLKGVI